MKVTCPHCGTICSVKSDLPDKTWNCWSCSGAFTAPSPCQVNLNLDGGAAPVNNVIKWLAFAPFAALLVAVGGPIGIAVAVGAASLIAQDKSSR